MKQKTSVNPDDTFGTLRTVEKELYYNRQKTGRPPVPRWVLECICGNLVNRVPEWELTSGRRRTCSDGHSHILVEVGTFIKTETPPAGPGIQAEVLNYAGWRPELAYHQGRRYTRQVPYYRVHVSYSDKEEIYYLNDLQLNALDDAYWHPLEFYGDAIKNPPDGLRESDTPIPKRKPKGGSVEEDITGRVFGHWKVLPTEDSLAVPFKKRNRMVDCRCVCGTVHKKRRQSVMALRYPEGRGLSCGCQNNRLPLEEGKEYRPDTSITKRYKPILSGPFWSFEERGFQVSFIEALTDGGRYERVNGELPPSHELVKSDFKGEWLYRVHGRCACGTEIICSLLEARGRASSCGCRCDHYRDMTRPVMHMYREYVAIVLNKGRENILDQSYNIHEDPLGMSFVTHPDWLEEIESMERVQTDKGWELLPSRIVDYLETKELVMERPSGKKLLPRDRLHGQVQRKITGVCREWNTFEGFLRTLPRPEHEGQRLIKLDKNRPWCPENVAWCVADRPIFSRKVSLELVEQANKKNHYLTQVPEREAGVEMGSRLFVKARRPWFRGFDGS